MPGQSNSQKKKGKGLSRNDQRGLAANTKIMNAVMADGIDENSMRFGKVTKMVGNSRVEVAMSDGRDTNALIRDVLRAKGSCGIGVGTVVLLGLPDWEKEFKVDGPVARPVAYVEGIVNTKKIMDFLRARGDIPDRFFVELGEGGKVIEPAFEFGVDSDDEEETPRAKSNVIVSAVEEDEESEDDRPIPKVAVAVAVAVSVAVVPISTTKTATATTTITAPVIKDKREASASKHGGCTSSSKAAEEDDGMMFSFE
jgi:translation initiation factor IF-1